MKTSEAELQFKGDRTYIQGPDIFNKLIEFAQGDAQAKKVRFSVHGFVRTPQCRIHFAESFKALNAIENLKARCQFEMDGATQWLGLTEGEEGATAGERYPYDEAQVTNRCHLEGETIRLEGGSPYTFVETIVAMNKHLLQSLFPDAPGKWIFTRLDLDRISAANERISLKFVSNLNFRLTKSEVWVGDEKLGDIYFSVVKQ